MEINHRQTAPPPRCHRVLRSSIAGFLLVLSIVPMWAQAQTRRPVQPTAKDKRAPAATGTKPAGPAALPQKIRVGSAEMPLTDLVPSTEAALSRLQQVLAKTRDPALAKLQQSLDALSDRVAKS